MLDPYNEPATSLNYPTLVFLQYTVDRFDCVMNKIVSKIFFKKKVLNKRLN